ncbi:MAG: hypothetical protein K0S09_1518 [Sphingobacteriaceae bacterium]|jgi:hypothetical protein|nr:hypothetical protein [Sphingobacteriaceae bacterium]
MKKTLTIILFLSTSIGFVTAQESSGAIEVRLNLLHQENTGNIGELALTTSVINHTGKDIYLPKFQLFAAITGIHVYEKQDTIWREVDVMRERYYQPVKGGVTTRQGNTIIHFDTDAPAYNAPNTLAKSFNQGVGKVRHQQDSIMKAYYNSAPDHHQLSPYVLIDEKPVFLKVGEELHNFSALDLNYLLTKKKEYMITFNSEARDSLNYYGSSRVYDRLDNNWVRQKLPENIFNYQLFYPIAIVSNILLFDNRESFSHK